MHSDTHRILNFVRQPVKIGTIYLSVFTGFQSSCQYWLTLSQSFSAFHASRKDRHIHQRQFAVAVSSGVQLNTLSSFSLMQLNHGYEANFRGFDNEITFLLIKIRKVKHRAFIFSPRRSDRGAYTFPDTHIYSCSQTTRKHSGRTM